MDTNATNPRPATHDDPGAPDVVCFLDTETTGTDLFADEIWEIGCVRRDRDGSESTLHLFVDHDRVRAGMLPEPFRSDHCTRYNQYRAVPREHAARSVSRFTGPRTPGERVAVIGCVPAFDMYRLEMMLHRAGIEPAWHYRPVCVETVAVGWLLGRAQAGILPDGMSYAEVQDLCRPPWHSTALSRACDIEPPGDGVRHTAMGDVRWGMRWWDRIHQDTAL